MKRVTLSSIPRFNEWAHSRFPLGMLAAASCVLLFGGLSVRSLWGPEGRWGVIVKEMLNSGDYFLPTVNGMVYFDKPLLTYWAMLPFVWVGGLNETMLRLPGTLAGAGCILLVFLIGRRLFGSTAGLFSAAFLLTAPMFAFWSRTASAESMNAFAVLVMFWVFLVSRFDNRRKLLPLFYGVGAVASFIKGPVAPALALFVILVWSVAETLVRYREAGFKREVLRKVIGEEFFWLFSRPALVGMATGSALFAILLLAPVALGGSWVSVSLMWKENVIRFFSPFDHRDPPHAYFVSILQFSAPWSFLVIAGIWRVRFWSAGRERRWTLLSAAGVLLFFLLSGSRRSYYILPLIPFLALIAGISAADWVKEAKTRIGAVGVAAIATMALSACLAAALFYIYLSVPAYHHDTELGIAILAAVGTLGALFFLLRRKRAGSLSVLLLVFFIVELWGFTVGMGITERERTLKAFAKKAALVIDDVGDANVALFHQTTAEVIFYLNRKSPLTEVKNVEEIERFASGRSVALLIIDLNDPPRAVGHRIKDIKPALTQHADPGTGEERLALLFLPPL